MRAKRIAVVVSGFPRRSYTFATNELLALLDHGMLAGIFATKPGDGCDAQPGNEKLQQFVHLLPNGSESQQAEFLASSLHNREVTALHGYFAHAPARVAQLAAERLRIPFGFSVHARDVRKVLPTELSKRAHRAACVVACNHDAAATLQRTGARVSLLPHGVDLSRFIVTPTPVTPRFRILAVGRLVEKKGFRFLIEAVARLKFPFELRIVGEGSERPDLAQLIVSKRLQDRVVLVGPLNHDELPQELSRAHVVAVPSVVDATGDRDGLPNVVLEAMASERPVIASDVGAISTAVRSGDTGLLVPMRESAHLAVALTELASQPEVRQRLGQNARYLMEREFDLRSCTDRFCRVLQDAYV